MAEPPPCGSIPTDIGKSFVTVSIRRTEGNLLYNLIHNHTTPFLLHNSAVHKINRHYNNTQNYPFCPLQFVVETFAQSTL